MKASARHDVQMPSSRRNNRFGRKLTTHDLAAIPIPKTRDGLHTLQQKGLQSKAAAPAKKVVTGVAGSVCLAAVVGSIIWQLSPAPSEEPDQSSGPTFAVPNTIIQNTEQPQIATTLAPPVSITSAASIGPELEQPIVLDVAANLLSPTFEAVPPRILGFEDAAIATPSIPPVLYPVQVAERFACAACTGSYAQLQDFTVRTVYSSPAIARKLTGLGVTETVLDAATVPPSQSQVRYYHASDAAAAKTLAAKFSAVVMDLTWVAASTSPKTIDLWIGATSPPD